MSCGRSFSEEFEEICEEVGPGERIRGMTVNAFIEFIQCYCIFF